VTASRTSRGALKRYRKGLKRWIRFWVLRVVLQPLAVLPLRPARRYGAAFGALAWCLMPGLRRRTLENLRAAFPEWPAARRNEVAAGVTRWIGTTGADVLHLGGPDHEALLESIQVRGLKHLPSDPGDRRGIVMVTGHLGNWELLGSWVASRGRPFRALYHSFHEKRLDGMVEVIRERAGVRGLAAGRSPLPAVRALRRGEVIGVLIDRVPRGRAVDCRFFGRECRTAPGAAWLAVTTGAPIIPVALFRRGGDGYLLDIREPLDPASGEWGSGDGAIAGLTRRLTSILEEQIREAPEQWPWFFDRWKIRTGEILGGRIDDDQP